MEAEFYFHADDPPNVGDYVTEGSGYYRIDECGSTIHTSNRGNYVIIDVSPSASGPDADDCVPLGQLVLVDTDPYEDVDSLIPEERGEGDWCVVDNIDGLSVWYPDDDALADIVESDDPEATAILICRNQPGRGEWRN